MKNNVGVSAVDKGMDPLEHMKIDVVLEGLLAVFNVGQKFKNTSEENIEAVFTFPTPYGSVLTNVRAKLNGKSLEATAMPKRSAENAYEDAVSSGDSAIMVEEVSPGLHCLSLGNLGPGEVAQIDFTYGILLEWHDDQLSVRIPTTIAPRYGTPDIDEYAVPEVNLSTVRKADFTMRIKDNGRGWSASSPTHSISISKANDDTLVSLGEILLMDRDIVIDVTGEDRTQALFAFDGESYVAIASFQAAQDYSSHEDRRILKIVVDRSGSMMGVSIDQARKAVATILQSLSEKDRFSIVGFGSRIENMTNGVVQASQSNISKALKKTTQMDADLGGTELREALQHTFALPFPDQGGLNADILLITDGETWDIEGVTAEARGSAHRVFTIGVGSAASEDLLKSISDETGGACEIVTPREGMAERIIRQFDRMDAPRMSGRIHWPITPETVWPAEHPQVFASDTVHCIAWFSDKISEDIRFETLSAGSVNSAQFVSASSQISEETKDVFFKVAAAMRLTEISDEMTATELAVKHGLMTKYTNLIMIDEREEKFEDIPKLHKVSHMLADGWHGTGDICASMDMSESRPLLMDCYIPSETKGFAPKKKVQSLFERVSGEKRSSGYFGSSSRQDLMDIPAFLRRSNVQDEPEEVCDNNAAQPVALDMLSHCLCSLAVDEISKLNLDWIRSAGVPEEVVVEMESEMAARDIDENDIVLGFLYMCLSDGHLRIPKSIARLIRKTWLGQVRATVRVGLEGWMKHQSTNLELRADVTHAAE